MISRTFKSSGQAFLDFGSNFYTGRVIAKLNGEIIAESIGETQSVVVEFDVNDGDIITIEELGDCVITIRDFKLIKAETLIEDKSEIEAAIDEEDNEALEEEIKKAIMSFLS